MLASDYISIRTYKDNHAGDFFWQNDESHTFSNSVNLNLQVIWELASVFLCLAKKTFTNIGQYGIINNNNLLRLGLTVKVQRPFHCENVVESSTIC